MEDEIGHKIMKDLRHLPKKQNYLTDDDDGNNKAKITSESWNKNLKIKNIVQKQLNMKIKKKSKVTRKLEKK